MGTRSFVQRLALMTRCVGESRASRTPVDLSGVLCDAFALQELVAELLLPFAQVQIDQVIALYTQSEDGNDGGAAVQRKALEEEEHEESVREKNSSIARGRGRAAKKDQEAAAAAAEERTAAGAGVGLDEAASDSEVHHFTSAIAGAMAGARQLAYSEATVITRAKSTPLPPVALKPKRGRALKGKTNSKKGQIAVVVPQHPDFVCTRVVSIDVGGGRCVELKRQTIEQGKKVLLVVDWIDQVDAILAVRDTIAKLGAEVVGVSFVVATNAALLNELKREQLLFSCSWTPPPGAEIALSRDQSVTRSIVPEGDTVVQNQNCSCHQPGSHRTGVAKKRKRSFENEDSTPKPPSLTHVTAQYQGNNPSEDRSVNIVKVEEDGIQVNAVFDGHGGSVAVDLKQAFSHCDEELKQSLLALPAVMHLSKGYCNSGACAAVALFVNSVLYVANVGDCAVAIGKTHPESGICIATQLSVEHSCSNADEIRLVLERSRDRNPIRLSKDDQANGAAAFGIKRVAGSLAVTRAFGDFYLKCEELSSAPFKSKVPYITVEPSVFVHCLDGSEKYLILASDGLWEVLTPDEVVQIVDGFDSTQSLFFSTVSAALIHAALEKIAHRDGLMLHEVLALPPGPERRRFHDDITCTVVYISHDIPGEEAEETEEETVDTTPAAVPIAASVVEEQWNDPLK